MQMPSRRAEKGDDDAVSKLFTNFPKNRHCSLSSSFLVSEQKILTGGKMFAIPIQMQDFKKNLQSILRNIFSLNRIEPFVIQQTVTEELGLPALRIAIIICLYRLARGDYLCRMQKCLGQASPLYPQSVRKSIKSWDTIIIGMKLSWTPEMGLSEEGNCTVKFLYEVNPRKHLKCT